MAARLIFAAMIGRVVPHSRPELAGMLFVNLFSNFGDRRLFYNCGAINRRSSQSD